MRRLFGPHVRGLRSMQCVVALLGVLLAGCAGRNEPTPTGVTPNRPPFNPATGTPVAEKTVEPADATLMEATPISDIAANLAQYQSVLKKCDDVE